MSQGIEIGEAQETRRGEGSTRTDRIGKVFAVVGQELRQCLICESVLTRRAASEHARIVCRPEVSTKTGGRMMTIGC